MKRCATEAIKPIKAIKIHWFEVGLIQTVGINKLIITVPIKPDNKSVRSGLSEVLNLRVIIR